jgi:hypothetical protein
MIGEIGYLGQVSPRTGRVSAGLFIAGCTVGGTAAGGLLGATGWVLWWLAAIQSTAGERGAFLPVAILALVGGLRDLGFIRVRLPQPACQVPRYWLSVLGVYWTPLLWGLCIGAGMRTRYQYAILHVLALWTLVNGDPLWGAGILGLCGAAQGVATVSAIGLSRSVTMRTVAASLPHQSGLFYLVSGACLLSLCVPLLVYALG